jgi:pimeloyl-ACP methyl ester carboxylesterase
MIKQSKVNSAILNKNLNIKKMKLFKKILKLACISMLLLFIGSSIYIYSSGPNLPEGTEEIISNIIKNPLTEIVKGKTGFANSQGFEIWYESISPKEPSKGAILLIMGISNDALGWPEKFVQSFVDSGYQVIRYDHRGTGMSDWVKNWDSENTYSLLDMAEDGIAVLNSLEIHKANIVGISMGGMIAQELAINHPERVLSLTSLMSSGYIEDPDLPKISSNIAWQLIKASLKYGIIGGEKNMIKLHLSSRIILMGNAIYDLNIKEISEQVLYNMRKRNGYNSNVSRQHQSAVFLSGSRYDKLKLLSIPTLFIHGKSDPFIPIEHSKKCVSIIPNADSLWLNDMGHDLPDNLVDTLSNRIIAHFDRKNG